MTHLALLKTYGIDASKIAPCDLVPVETMREHLQALVDYGFSKSNLQKMVQKFLALLSYMAERTNGILDNLTTYGFKKPDVIKMAVKFPALLSYTAERTNGIFKNLTDYGFKKLDIIKMVVKFPSILGCTAELTRAGLDVMAEIGFDVREKPGRLMFSPKLLRARLNFLRSKRLTLEDIRKCIFQSSKAFEDRFQISRQELIDDW